MEEISQNEDLINKLLRCLSREWQPKVTAISESRDLSNMSLSTLFGKLQKHEMELLRLHQNEENDKKKKVRRGKKTKKVTNCPLINCKRFNMGNCLAHQSNC